MEAVHTGPGLTVPPHDTGLFSYIVKFNFVVKSDMVVALLREMIITGQLTGGQQLRQRDLAAKFNVSQTPVREAMRRLEAEGLLAGDPHRGFTVVEAEHGSSDENYRIRAALESLAAALAAEKIDAAGITRLQGLNQELRALGEEDAAYAELNRTFHFVVYEYAGSPLLVSLMRLLWAALRGGPRVQRTHADSATQHDAIIDALRRGDVDGAAEATRDHIMGAERLD